MAKEFKKTAHIGQKLRKYVTENRIFIAAWAREQGVNPVTVARYFKRPTMRVSTLFTICQVLKYNFIREIADQLPAEFPPHPANPLQQRVSELEEENKMLKREIEIWKEAAGVKK
jgi:hypothetical protein